MPNTLLLCHGHKHKDSNCFTAFVKLKNPILLDKQSICNPDIIHDWKQPITFSKKFDIITTMCCDTDMFFDGLNIIPQCFINVQNALSSKGIFVMPVYIWTSDIVLKDIRKYLTFHKTVKDKYDTFHIFKKKHN